MKRPTCETCLYSDPPVDDLTMCRLGVESRLIGVGNTCGEHPDFETWSAYCRTVQNVRLGWAPEVNCIRLQNSISSGYYLQSESTPDTPNFSASKENATTFDSPLVALQEMDQWPSCVRVRVVVDDNKEEICPRSISIDIETEPN